MVAKLLSIAVTTFLAIVVWSKTRDVAWMFVVIGIVAGYADLLFSVLSEFGLVPERGAGPFGLPVAATVFACLPYVFFSVAFAIMISRKRGL